MPHWGLNIFYGPNPRPRFCCCQDKNDVYLTYIFSYLCKKNNNQIKLTYYDENVLNTLAFRARKPKLIHGGLSSDLKLQHVESQ